jgi:hypothetical protein
MSVALCLLRGRYGGEHLRVDISTGVEGEGMEIMQLIAECSTLIAGRAVGDWYSVCLFYVAELNFGILMYLVFYQ